MLNNPWVFGAIATVVAAGIAAITTWITATHKTKADKELALAAAFREYRHALTRRRIDGIARARDIVHDALTTRNGQDPQEGLFQMCEALMREASQMTMTGDGVFDRADRVAVKYLLRLSQAARNTLAQPDRRSEFAAVAGRHVLELDDLLAAMRLASEAYVFGRAEAAARAATILDLLDRSLQIERHHAASGVDVNQTGG